VFNRRIDKDFGEIPAIRGIIQGTTERFLRDRTRGRQRRDISVWKSFLSITTDTTGSESTGIFERYLRCSANPQWIAAEQRSRDICLRKPQEGDTFSRANERFGATDLEYPCCDIRFLSFQGTAEQIQKIYTRGGSRKRRHV
jgi:hypothetical protein